MHNLFIINAENFYEATERIFIKNKNKTEKNERISWMFDKKDLIIFIIINESHN